MENKKNIAQSQNKNVIRYGYLDAAKGLLLIFVIFGHITIASNTDNKVVNEIFHWVCVFHVPAFFVISGLLFNPAKWHERGIREFVKLRIYTIFIPLCFFEVLNAVLNYALFQSSLNIKGLVYELLCGYFSAGADWFLAAFLIVEFFMYFVTYIQQKWLLAIISIVAGALAVYLPEFWFSVNLYRGLMGLCFALLGYMCKAFFLQQEKKHVLVLTVAFVVSIGILILNGNVDMYSLVFHQYWLFLIGALSGTIFCIEICKYIDNIWFERIGRNSLIILGTHQAIIKVIQNLHIFDIAWYGFFILTILTIISGESCLIFILNRFVPFLVGNRSYISKRKIQ